MSYTASDFDQDIVSLARMLIGARLLVDGVGGTIVETEAYDHEDPASHSYSGPTARNQAMFGPAGHAYVYRSYGIHWCFNVVGRPGSAVLIRALEPEFGIDIMGDRRGLKDPLRLCKGPGCVGQALGLDADYNGAPLYAPPFAITPTCQNESIICGPRIGITKGAATPWRFGRAGSAFLSRKF